MREGASMKQAIFFFLSLILVMGIWGTGTVKAETEGESGAAQEGPTLYAQSAVLMDAQSGRILFGKNEELSRPMASTTKIMTCIVALENGNLSDTVTVSKNAAAQPKVHLGAFPGETFKLEDLLYSLMLESHNDAAVMIAEHVGGSVEGFAAMMNQKARDLGCFGTYFITPNGLDAKEEKDGVVREHSTTAADLARIMNYCIGHSPEKEEFLKITGTQSYYFTDLTGKHSYNCTNHNALLSMMNGAISGKTGFTGGAGYSYVGALKDGERTFTIALLGCGWPPHKTYKWSDARKLFDYGKANYEYREVFEERVFPEIVIEEGIPSTGNLRDTAQAAVTLGLSEEEKSLRLLLAENETVEISEELPKRLPAPVEKGQAVGSVTYRLNGETVKTYPVYLSESVDRISFGWCFHYVLSHFPGIFSPST